MRNGVWLFVVILTAFITLIIPASSQAQSSQPSIPSFNAMMVDTICADVNYDGVVNIGDAIFIMEGVFKCGPAPQPYCLGDVNDDGACNIGDTVYLLNYIFRGGPAPMPCCTEAIDRTIMQRSVKCGG